MLNNTKEILTLKELQELLHIGKNTALRFHRAAFQLTYSMCSAARLMMRATCSGQFLRKK